MKNEVYAYIRTSNTNKKKAAESDSQTRQLKDVRAFCRKKKLKIKEIFSDLGVSGDTGFDLSKREAYSQMLAQMKSNGIKKFVVADASRYSRSIITAAIMGEDLRNHEIGVIDASTGRNLAAKNDNNPEEALIQNILLCFSQYEKMKTVSRLQGARRRKKKAGGSVGGNPSIGKTDTELAVLHRIKELLNQKDEDGNKLTQRQICKILNEENYLNRFGRPFNPVTVSNYCKRAKELGGAL